MEEKSFRQSMSWLHTWGGLVFSWLLFAIFVTGTSAYYKKEISYWMKPELFKSIPNENTFNIAKSKSIEVLKKTSEVNVELPNDRSPVISISWSKDEVKNSSEQNHRKRNRITQYYDASTGEEIFTRESAGGNFLYRFHYILYNIPRDVAQWIVSIVTLAMLVAIISGIIIHKRIFKDIFTFRPKKGVRSWMDLHILPAVATIPFLIMITYSGLVLYKHTILPFSFGLTYDGDFRKYREDLNSLNTNLTQNQEKSDFKRENRLDNKQNLNAKRPHRTNNREKTDFNLNKNITIVLEKAENIWPSNIGAYSISKNGSTPTISIKPKESKTIFTSKFGSEVLTYDLKTTKLISQSLLPPSKSNIINTNSIIESLHRAIFANPVVRFIFFISGICSIIVLASGLIIWTKKRKQKSSTTKGYKLVEKLNISFIMGVMIAIGFYFLSNRFIPVEENSRQIMEINCFFIGWLISIVHAFIRDSKKAWFEQLFFAGAIYLLIVLTGSYSSSLSFFDILVSGNWFIYSFYIYFIIQSALFLFASYYIKRKYLGVKNA